ncbi:histone-like nucleoid-structuring protein Lsr2 [Schaalia vaccimaxillae]|uniref:histone-like nucleoid-structuring protein Lsr2 n=1 Tax=Schaalia vaccimaxillae TaxID=183916 RepID=UPI0003B618ED|nr:Lsr2 family protein [Schaalia vaccimaxillae]
MKKTIVQLVDDIDGTAADRTVSFAFNGVSYEIDLNEAHANDLAEDLERWIKAARRTGGRVAPRSGRASAVNTETAKIREWAKANNVEVNERGRIPAAIVEQYRAAAK